MDTILVKIFATALALSQVTAKPEAVKTQFDPVTDQVEVVALLRAGCAQMRKTFDIESLNLDDLIATAMEDPQAVAGDVKAFKGLNFADLHVAYRQFCKNEQVAKSPVEIGEVIAYYNNAVATLPDYTKLKGMKLPGASMVLDGKGARFTEIFEADNRRTWIPLTAIPDFVQRAFVAAEDRRFFQHKGIDERGLIRAFVANLAQSGRPQGGSTITQQVVKTLLVGDDVTYDRKIREIIASSGVESTLTKAEILELYLNSIYLGRNSWGIEMAARSYFGKSAAELTVSEGALLAGLTKGPSYFSPDRYPDRARERVVYVVNRMQEDGVISAEQAQDALQATPKLVAYERPRRDTGLHFIDHLGREAKASAGLDNLTGASYTVRSTINPALQRATEAALQEGLARYEINHGRTQFQGAELNLSEAVRRIEADKTATRTKPAWQLALEGARLPLYDVHWAAAIVVDKGRDRGGADTIRVGTSDGQTLPLTTWSSAVRRSLNLYDVVYVRIVDPKGKSAGRAELRTRPAVQGAAMVLENKTGRILAMVGSFSYPLSQLNRTTQTVRQPGSALKPLTYLTALRKGLQPNTLVRDEPITLPPIGHPRNPNPDDWWSPKNYEGGSYGLMTLRRALENSRNLVTARLLDGGIEKNPEESLDRVCDLALEAQIYKECVRYYPFVLGAQPVRLVDLAAFYAAIANEGERPTPYAIESIERNGETVYQHSPSSSVWVGAADHVAFYQLKTMLQGVLQRGTARSISYMAPYVGGKTGTTDEENDTWFVGFSNDTTVAVWVGYDNADGKRRTLGEGSTGASVAVPIFEPIMESVWALQAPKVALSGPSPEAQRELVALPIDLNSGDRVSRSGGRSGFTEYFRRDQSGKLSETQYRLVSRGDSYIARDSDLSGGAYEGRTVGRRAYEDSNGPFAPGPRYREPPRPPQPMAQDQFRPYWRNDNNWGWRDEDERVRRAPQRVDPDYFFGQQRDYR